MAQLTACFAFRQLFVYRGFMRITDPNIQNKKLFETVVRCNGSESTGWVGKSPNVKIGIGDGDGTTIALMCILVNLVNTTKNVCNKIIKQP